MNVMKSVASMSAVDDGQNEGLIESSNVAGLVRVVSGSGFRYVVPFPWRLHQMLEETEAAGSSSVVSWLPDGKHFKVHDTKGFLEDIVPRFFKQKSYKSFQRQLHIYGFARILKGPSRGAYFHPKFIRNDRQLTHDIVRVKAPTRKQPSKVVGKSNNLEAEEKESCSASCESNTTLPLEQVSAPATSSLPAAHDSTNMWLVGAGVAFSDLDPTSIDFRDFGELQKQQVRASASSSGLSSSLMACADEISSLFGDSAKKLSSSPPSNGSLSLLVDKNAPRHQEAFFSNNDVLTSSSSIPPSNHTEPQQSLSFGSSTPEQCQSMIENYQMGLTSTSYSTSSTIQSSNSSVKNSDIFSSMATSIDDTNTDEFLSITGQWINNSNNNNSVQPSGGWFN